MKPMTKQDFLQRVAALHTEWAKTARVVVDPRYSNNSPSQYAEGIEAVSAIAEDDEAWLKAASELMDEYDRSNGRPTRAERTARFLAKREAQKAQAHEVSLVEGNSAGDER